MAARIGFPPAFCFGFAALGQVLCGGLLLYARSAQLFRVPPPPPELPSTTRLYHDFAALRARWADPARILLLTAALQPGPYELALLPAQLERLALVDEAAVARVLAGLPPRLAAELRAALRRLAARGWTFTPERFRAALGRCGHLVLFGTALPPAARDFELRPIASFPWGAAYTVGLRAAAGGSQGR